MTITLQKRQTDMVQLPLCEITPSPYQPRRNFDSDELSSLASSIRSYGVLQPLVVTPAESGYYLVAGERRLRAAAMAGLDAVPCLIYHKPTEDCAVATMVENLQRQSLSYWEEAYGYKTLLEQFHYTQEQLAAKVGKSQSTVANKLRLLKLPIPIQSLLISGGLTERHARALLQLTDSNQMYKVVETILERHYTVVQTERYIERLLRARSARPKPKGMVRDRRVFSNTIRRAVTLIRQAGIPAETETSETDAYLQYIIRIPKEDRC